MVREKYLPYVPPEKKEEPKTPQQIRKEKRENFWFYYKKPIIIGIVALSFIIFAWSPWAKEPDPDYTVMLTSRLYWSDEYTDALGEMLSFYGEDQNGDGKVIVDVIPYVIDRSNGATDQESAESLEAYLTKLVADISVGKDFIYLCDEDCLNWLGKQEGLFSRLDSEFTDIDWEGDTSALKLEDYTLDWRSVGAVGESKQFKDLDLKLYFCIRAYKGTAVGHETEYTACKALMSNMLSGNLADAQGYQTWLAAQQTTASSAS